jgi:transposase-like protein
MSAKHDFNLAKWRELIRDCQQSGLHVTEWCANRGYTKHAYYYWLNQLREEYLKEAAKEPPAAINAGCRMVEIKRPVLQPAATSRDRPAASIRYGSITIDLSDDVTAGFISRILEAVNNVPSRC